MSFDKTKAMRSAERFLTQGKIRSAITEYKSIVEDNPKDFSTLNILGDLHIKNSDEAEAIKCFMQVAEHYNGQGFANKAIAIYNKISKIIPDSVEVSGKLAQLYQTRGSNAEALVHYQVLADNYESTGRKPEAIAIWNKIADLDPKETDVYFKIAEVSLKEKQTDDAADAYTKVGLRFCEMKQYEPAIEAFQNARDLKQLDSEALKGFVEAQIGLGCADEAISILKVSAEENPYNRDIQYLLVDCYLDLKETEEAEKLIIKLVEQEPANYHKLVDLVEIYSKENELESAVRVLSIASEYLLTGGQAVDFLKWTNEILARNPENIDALRMLVRYQTWQRDETEVKNSLERLAETAQITENFEEEMDALSRLLMMYPREARYAERIHELKAKYNLDDSAINNGKSQVVIPNFEHFEVLDEPNESGEGYGEDNKQFEDFEGDVSTANEVGFDTLKDFKLETFAGSNGAVAASNGHFQEVEDTSENGFQMMEGDGYDFAGEQVSSDQINTPTGETENNLASDKNLELSAVDELKLHKEIESIEFYIAQEYTGIAVQSLVDLQKEFGMREEFAHLREQLADDMPVQAETPEPTKQTERTKGFEFETFESDEVDSQIVKAVESEEIDLPTSEEENSEAQIEDIQSIEVENFAQEEKEETGSEELTETQAESSENVNLKSDKFFDDFRNELGLEESEETADESDYDTHYQTAIAYKEMGLMEDAIKEFQNAINLVKINDGTRRFFQCSNLLGHCFMVKEMPSLAITWYDRALETADLNVNEIQALNYELAIAYEATNEHGRAIEYFKKIYAEDVEYRDVSKRLENLDTILVVA